MPPAKRAIFLGLDAMVPTMTEKFLAEGVLPNIARLVKRGGFSRVRPVIPAQTPTNWTTLATGATPGGHGVVQWGSHIPGEPVWEYHRGEAFNAGLCRAEYLWETAARHGIRSVVMNYAGYPPTTDQAVFIDWLFQPARSYYDLAAATVYHNREDLSGGTPVELAPAEGWCDLPDSKLPPLEAVLEVPTATEGTGPTLYALVWSKYGTYDTVSIARAKENGGLLETLAAGKWSDWVRCPFVTEDQGEAEGAFRFSLLKLSGDASDFRLFRTDAFPTDGRHCSDPVLGRRIMDELGPYLHAGGACGLQCHGVLDIDTVDKVMSAEARWWSGAARLAMDASGARLLYLHWHILDEMGHTFVPRVDPTGTDYDPEQLEENWGILRRYYQAADRFVGAFMEQFDDGETAVVIASDHGTPANQKAVSLVNVFKQRGWVTLAEDGKSVDWRRSKVFFAQNHLWINLQGRDEGGIVPPEDYRALRDEIIAAMRDIKDPETGQHVLPIVLAREDAPMIGLWGDYIGDIAFVYAGGYRWSGDEVLRMGEERVVFPCGGGNHGPMIPTFETEVASVMGTLIMAGAGVRSGVKLPWLEQFKLCTTDVAPTIAHLLGIPAPAQSEGRPLQEFLADLPAERPSHPLRTTERALVRRPAAKPRPATLQGDVTDEQ